MGVYILFFFFGFRRANFLSTVSIYGHVIWWWPVADRRLFLLPATAVGCPPTTIRRGKNQFFSFSFMRLGWVVKKKKQKGLGLYWVRAASNGISKKKKVG
jgi:hypothetical protein